MNPSLAAELRSIQKRLRDFYGLERSPDVAAFTRAVPPHRREQLLVREASDALEIEVRVPTPTGRKAERSVDDGLLQRVEGVSHFLYLTERARVELPATLLELELQAEVDKFVVLAVEPSVPTRDSLALHERLYERVAFLHPADSEAGRRYRLANRLAARLAARVASLCSDRQRKDGRGRAKTMLRRFYRSGQAEKIRMAETG